jgi:hypothetical protein
MQIKFTNISKDMQLSLSRVLNSGATVVLNVGESVTHPVNELKTGWQNVVGLFKEHLTHEVIDPAKVAAQEAADAAAKAESEATALAEAEAIKAKAAIVPVKKEVVVEDTKPADPPVDPVADVVTK